MNNSVSRRLQPAPLMVSAALILVACSTPAPNSEQETAPAVAASETADSSSLCVASGPQTPRDISSTFGLNETHFALAPPPSSMNLCNVHAHTNAEHKGPGFSVFVGEGDFGGYACNETGDLSDEELLPAPGAYQNVEPGDTIEVHWVHTSCAAAPGPGLAACVPAECSDPMLRVEAQSFLVVNDPGALDFEKLAYGGTSATGFSQAGSIPDNTGEPVVFRGSTTGPSYTQSSCSPAQVTWSVRPMCTKLDINSLHRWAENGNVFEETKSHGVRQLVTAPELLSPIE